MLQPKKPVVKKTTKKTKSVSERLGDTTLRDVKNAGEDMLQLTTLGGYGKIKKALGGEYKYKKIGEKKYGGKISKAKNGTSLGMKSVKAGFDKNPGVTRADIITAATKKAKNGKPVKKAFLGSLLGGGAGKSMLGGIGKKMLGGLLGKNGKSVKKAKSGTLVKKAQDGNTIRGLRLMGENSRKVSRNKSKYVSEDGNYKLKFKGSSDNSAPTNAVQRRTLKGFLKGAPKAAGKMALKSGGSMKKCKGGC